MQRSLQNKQQKLKTLGKTTGVLPKGQRKTDCIGNHYISKHLLSNFLVKQTVKYVTEYAW